MVNALIILLIITLCGMNFVMGFFIGKGKIEIKRKLTEQEKKILEESENEQKRTIEEFNRRLQSIIDYDGGE